MKEKQITTFIHPSIPFDTEYGYISGENWLKLEQKRIPKSRIIEDEFGNLALVREVSYLNEEDLSGIY